mgnify:FL=1
MPLGIISDDAMQAELERLEKVGPRALIIHKPGVGRTPEKENTPESIRKVIATEPLEARGELASLFNVGIDSVSNYRDGNNARTIENPELKLVALGARERVAKKARNRLNLALNHITEDKLSDAKLSEISSVARDMSTIVKNMEPPAEQGGNKLNAQFVFFAPRLKSESDYDSVIVSEQ